MSYLVSFSSGGVTRGKETRAPRRAELEVTEITAPLSSLHPIPQPFDERTRIQGRPTPAPNQIRAPATFSSPGTLRSAGQQELASVPESCGAPRPPVTCEQHEAAGAGSWRLRRQMEICMCGGGGGILSLAQQLVGSEALGEKACPEVSSAPALAAC